MRLASDAIEVTLRRGHTITLKPSLRAALRLERSHGIRAVFAGIADGNMSMIAEIIREGADERAFADLLEDIGAQGLRITLDTLTAPALAFLTALLPHDAEEPAHEGEGEPMALLDLYRTLYQIGTGYLGYTPAETWAATPLELIHAKRGKDRFWTSIFIGTEPTDTPSRPDTKRDEAGFATLKAMSSGGIVAAT